MLKKVPNPIDRHVGSRLRMRRVLVGLSQEKLGDALKLTFQQIQKYEKGMNRIGASRLQEISGLLGVPVEFFFEGAPQNAMALEGNGFEDETASYVSDFLGTNEGVQLNRAFVSLNRTNSFFRLDLDGISCHEKRRSRKAVSGVVGVLVRLVLFISRGSRGTF